MFCPAQECTATRGQAPTDTKGPCLVVSLTACCLWPAAASLSRPAVDLLLLQDLQVSNVANPYKLIQKRKYEKSKTKIIFITYFNNC